MPVNIHNVVMRGIMRPTIMNSLSLLTVLFLVLFCFSCANTENKEQAALPKPQARAEIIVRTTAIPVPEKELLGNLGFFVFENETIYFEYGSYSLSPEAKSVLKRKADWLKLHPSFNVFVEGHSDSTGSERSKIAIGNKRAENVKAHLVDLGVEASRLETTCLGDLWPAGAGQTEEAHALNRRVVIIINKMSSP